MSFKDGKIVVHEIEAAMIKNDRLLISGYSFLRGHDANGYASIESSLILAGSADDFNFDLASVQRSDLSERFGEKSDLDYSFGGYATFDHYGIDLSEVRDGKYDLRVSIKQSGIAREVVANSAKPISFWAPVGSSLVNLKVTRDVAQLVKRPLISATLHRAFVEVSKFWNDGAKFHIEGYFVVPGVPAQNYAETYFYLSVREISSGNVARVFRFAPGNKSNAGDKIDDPWINYSKAYFSTPDYAGVDVSGLPSGHYELVVTGVFGDSVFSHTLSHGLVVDLLYGIQPELEKPTVGVIGSCVSRDNFSSRVVNDWKSYFSFHGNQYQMSFVSLMAEPVTINSDAFLDIDNHSSQATLRDFRKSYRFELMESAPDVLVIDFRSDARFGCIEFGGSLITNNEWKLHQSSLYHHIESPVVCSMRVDQDAYVDLFIDAAKRFEVFRAKYLSETRIVLNSARAVSLRFDRGRRVPMAPKMNRDLNGYWAELDDMFLKHVSVSDVISMPAKIQGDSNHAWGPGPVHFERRFYMEFRDRMLGIVNAKSVGQIVIAPDA